MANLTSVTLTAGVPTAGTGTVGTIDNVTGTAGSPSVPVLTVQGVASGTPQPVSLTSTTITGTAAVTQSGTWTVQPGNTANTTAWKVDGSAVTQPVSIATAPVLVAGSAIIGKVTTDQTTHGTTDKVAADLYVGGAATDKGSGTSGTATQRVIVDSSQIGALIAAYTTLASANATPVALPTDQPWPKGMSPRAFAVAFTTNTRPANTTAYTAGDSISNNATAGSVTALTASVSDTNDDPVTITDVLLTSTDTGLAGKRIRAYLFNSDPTANTGVGGGDNAAFSQKIAGYVGSVSGVMETGFSDGTVGRLVPTYNDSATAPAANAPAGGLIVAKPSSGGKSFWIEYQAEDGFTPSANSTTLIGTLRGFQGRAG